MDISPMPEKRPTGDPETSDENKRFKLETDENKISTFDFTVKTWKDDFILTVENKRLYVSKAILAHASPVFDRMFQADFMEKNLTELELPGKKFEDVKHFLHCIYPSQIDVDAGNVKSILPLAEEYQVSYLKSKCESCLKGIINDETISSDEVYNLLELASMYSMSDLLGKCIELASERSIESLHRAEGRMTIQPKVKLLILEKIVSKLQPNSILKVLKNYYEAIVTPDKKLGIKDYGSCDGESLKFSAEIKKPALCKMNLFGISTEFSLQIEKKYNQYMVISLNMKTDKTEDRSIYIVGAVVIRSKSKPYEYVAKQFKFHGGTVENWKLADINIKHASGYIYQDKIDVEVHVLAERR